MAERKKRFSGLYWQQFALTAGMVMLTLLLRVLVRPEL